MEVYLQGGPFNGRTWETDGGGQSLKLKVDERFVPGGAYAFAVYSRTKSGVFRFAGFETASEDQIELEFWDGPCKSVAHFYRIDAVYRAPFRVANSAILDVVGVGIYELCHVPYPQGRQWGMVCRRVDTSPVGIKSARDELYERLRDDTLRGLYRKTSAMKYSHVQGQHTEVEVDVYYRHGRVDEVIAPLIQELWRLGMDTIASCQERPHDWGDAGLAYIEFARASHARAFRDVLTGKGIDTKFKETTWGGGGGGPDSVEFDGARVFFDPKFIGSLTEHFAVTCDPPGQL